MVQNFAVFADRSVAAKIRTANFSRSSCELLVGINITGADLGRSWGADDCPFSLKMMASFRKIEPFNLAKLQLFQTFSKLSCIKHSKLTSKFKI